MFKKKKVFKWSGRILASLVTLLICWGLIAVFLFGGYNWPEEFGITHTAMIVVILIGLAGIILSWKRPEASGYLLIANSIVIGIAICTLWTETWDVSLYCWLMVGLPYLVAGILQIAACSISPESQSF
jgi:hypothetical protein